MCKVSFISIDNKWSYMHYRGRPVFINNLVIFGHFLKMTRFLKSIKKQKVFIPGLWYLKLEILFNWKLTYSKIRNFHWKDFKLLAFEHVRLKRGHTVYCVQDSFSNVSKTSLEQTNEQTLTQTHVLYRRCISLFLFKFI